MISNTVRRLLENRGAWDAIAGDAKLIASAVEEALRFDSSNIAWRRVTTRAVSLRGIDIPAGARLLLLLGAANHDPERYADPDAFNIRRAEARTHLAFGKGIHYCLGAALTRLELGIVLELLVERFPGLDLAANREYAYVPNVVFRGPTSLPVTLA